MRISNYLVSGSRLSEKLILIITSAAWVQWLRHTRNEAPTIQEQQYDVIRQQNMKQLAAAADARWASEQSLLKKPLTEEFTPALSSSSTEPLQRIPQSATHDSRPSAVEEGEGSAKQAKGSPRGENEAPKEKQPDAWKPKLAKR